LTALPLAASAQFSFNSTNDSTTPQAAVGGVPAFDLIYLSGLGPGVPLRKGNVIPGSERVQLNGDVLQAGPDYGMDYVAGVVYVKHSIKPGDSLTVFYRYDDKAAQPSPTQANGFSTMKLDLMPGKFGLLAGLGMAERNPDGTMATSNVFGFNSNFSSKSSKLNGIFLFSQKSNVHSQQLMGSPATPGAPSTQQFGDSNLIVQNYVTQVGKGNITADYQDVSKSFTDFGAALAAGYDAKVVDQLSKEKGLKRVGFAMTDVPIGTLDVSQSFKSIQDGSNELDWKSFGLKQGGFDFNFRSQYISKGFTRFNDLSEADKAQLAKEAGMSRQSFGADLAEKFGKLSFADSSVGDGAGGSLNRQELALDSTKYKFNIGQQNVGLNFSRISSLLPAEQAMFGGNLGVRRQWVSVDANAGKNLQPIHFATTDLSTSAGTFKSDDFSAGGKTWTIEHADRDMSQNFASFAALAPDAANQLKTIANMYQKDPIALRPVDTQIFLSTAGLSRDFNRLTFTPNATTSLMLQQLQIKGSTSTSFVDIAALTAKNLSVTYRKEDLGSTLDPNSLVQFERDRLGMLAGLDRTDIGLKLNLGGNRSLAVNQTDASLAADSVSRDTLEYKDKKIDIQAGARNLSAGASFVNQLVDPEQQTLTNLVGFKEHDLKVSWQVLPTMKLDAYDFDSTSESLDQERKLSNILFDWKPNKNAEFSYYHYLNHNFDPTALLLYNSIDQMTMFKDFGKYGKLQIIDQKQDNTGSLNTTPGSEQQSVTYESQINPRTSLKTQETTTKYGDGTKQDTSTQTLSTSLTKQLGVSVSDVQIEGPTSAQEQNKRNYGFWYDFGHGVRFNYGYASQLIGGVSTLQNQATLTGGQVGDWKVGNGAYTNNFLGATDDTQTTTQFALGTVKPMRLGFLKDVTVNMGWDSSVDHSIWLKENKILSFAGKLGYNEIGFDYHSQVLQTNQRGIDRGLTFKTDPNDKKWLRAAIVYKERNMPDGTKIAIRNMTGTARLTKGVEVSNSVITNPEQPNAGVLLGTVPLANRKNSWKLEYKPTAQPDPYKSSATYGANWDELFNDQSKTLTRTAGTTYKLTFGNAKSVKPDDPAHSALTLFYGLEENDTSALRRLAQRYYIQFDQRPGEDQSMNLIFGNVSYEHSIADGFHRDNWTVGINYQFKF